MKKAKSNNVCYACPSSRKESLVAFIIGLALFFTQFQLLGFTLIVASYLIPVLKYYSKKK